MSIKIRFLFWVFVILSSPALLWATGDRFPTFDIWPTVGDRSFFMTPSTDGLYRRQYSLELSNQYVWRPLDLIDPTGLPLRPVVDHFFGHFLSGGFGLTDFWQVGFTLPLFSNVSFEGPTAPVGTGLKNFTNVGDLRLAMKLRILNANRLRVGLAFEPFVTIPLGADEHFLGYPTVTGGGRAIGDLFITRRTRLALSLGPEFLADDVRVSNIAYSHRWLTSAGLSVAATRKVTISGEAQANTAFRNFFSDRNTIPIELLANAKWEVGRTGLTVGVGGGTCLICGARGARGRGFVNIGYRRMNEVYTLKQQQALKMRYVALGGEPEPALTIYEINELVEKCPIDSSRYQADRDSPQCMQIYELQQVAASCPLQANFDELRDNPTCVEIYTLQEKDSDHDGSPDFIDWCPNDRGTSQERGCPAKGAMLADVVENQILSPLIFFEYDRSEILPNSQTVLDRLVDAMKEHPKIELLAIEGHTDDNGEEEYNLLLSQDRAEAVYRYLVEHGGIEPSRLTHEGFGQKFPIASNETEEGQAKNRRVEFIIDRLGK